jgi:arylsulfatase A-like enzyme
MNLRILLFRLALSGVAGGVLSGCSPRGVELAPERRQPNLIFLLTDDHRWDALGAAGNPIIQTPRLDELAGNGVRFRNAYVTTPICSISRASILTGQYERRHGIHDFATALSPEAFAQTYPALLREAGYWTGFIGKYGVGREMPADQFDVWHGFPGQGKYETVDPEGRPIHLTRLMGRQAVEFLENAPAERPFALSVSFKAPHVQDEDPRQFIPDPADAELYRGVTIPIPHTASSRHLERLPPFLRADSTESRLRWQKRFATPEVYRESVKNYYRLITGVDKMVGEIRDALRRRGQDDNTVIVFMGDNGFFLGEHGLAGKWYGYEESIRVPLVVYDPRLPEALQGRVREEMALNIDIAPTLLALAGIPAPAGMQGRNLLPLIRAQPVEQWREDFLFEHLFQHPRIPRSDGAVSRRYKYLRYFDQQPVYEQLFDLETDPHETTNLVGRSEYASVLARMRSRYRELVTAAGTGATAARPPPGPVVETSDIDRRGPGERHVRQRLRRRALPAIRSRITPGNNPESWSTTSERCRGFRERAFGC